MTESNLKKRLQKWSEGLGYYFNLLNECRKDKDTKNNNSDTPTKQRFQHKYVSCENYDSAVKETLAKEEKEGWELCAVIDKLRHYNFFFKKPLD